jgi:hypothetical protein
VGAAFTASIALVFMLVFAWPGLPLFAGSIGAVSGGAAWRVANHLRHPETDRIRQVSLIELLVLVAAVAAHFAAYTV